MVQYLLKFVSKFDYAKDFMQGRLYMNPLAYYRYLESKNSTGQGDIAESSVSSYQCIYKGSHYPIFCMTAIEDEDINNGEIVIDKRMISEFGCEDGYVIVVPLVEFEKCLDELRTNKYDVYSQKVEYGYISMELMSELICTDSLQNIFIKRPPFSYQKEYRILVTEKMKKIIEYKYFSDLGENVEVLKGYEAKTYSINSGLMDIAKCYNVNSLRVDDKNYFIPEL